jgi:N-acetylmuramoyl-L-alanine amidase
MMNELGVDVVLRLHCNGATNQSLRGIGLFVKSAGDGAEASYAISEYLIAAMGGATGAPTEPIHVRDNYSGLNWSTVPSILVEMGYMSNPEEDRLLCSESYQALLVQGMVRGLENYFADHPVPAPTAAPTPTAMPESVGE